MKAIFVMQPHKFDLVYAPEERTRLESELGQEVRYWSPESLATAGEALLDTEVILSGWGCPLLDAPMLSKMPRLRALLHGAGTVRTIASPELFQAGVRVSSAVEMNAIPVVDYTIAAAVFASKFVMQHARAAQARERFVPPSLMGLYGAPVGLIGFSRIGARVAGRLLDLGAKVLVVDPFLSHESAARHGVTLVEKLEELFERCVIVSCHAPLLPSTEGMVTGDLLRRLPRGGHFINTSRGPIVRESELIEVLRERPDLSATVDVTNVEPLPLDSPLRELPNLLLTPHIAGSQGREAARLGRFAMDELRRLRNGEPLLGEVRADQLASIA